MTIKQQRRSRKDPVLLAMVVHLMDNQGMKTASAIQKECELRGIGKNERTIRRYMKDAIAGKVGLKVSRLKLTKLSDVKPKEVDWFWEGRIAFGENTIIAGMPGVGKSYLTLAIASHVSTGSKWPDGADCDVGNVFFITAEDSLEHTVVPRLKKLGADLDRIEHIDMESLVLGKHLSDIEEALVSEDISLVVIDPIAAVIGNKNTHKASDVRQFMIPIAEMAERTQTAIITVSCEKDTLNRVSGSVFFVAEDPVITAEDSLTHDNLRGFWHIKSNLSKLAEPLAFKISEVNGFQWSSKQIITGLF
jgi:putative DNA primase/helicase